MNNGVLTLTSSVQVLSVKLYDAREKLGRFLWYAECVRILADRISNTSKLSAQLVEWSSNAMSA